ncbi:MAG: hypothetical protein LUC24_02780 [Bacteroidales bacterium]|nr:hypothetical protein [Bacteroidales bacterium]
MKTAFQQWLAEYLEAHPQTERQTERQQSHENNGETLVDSAAVMGRLGIGRSTLWRWNNAGYLVCHKVGGRNCYLLADVERIEQGMRPNRPVWKD